jgi:hypothetical protein
MNEEIVTPNKGGRPPKSSPPTTAQAVRELMAQELVKTAPDRFKVQGLSRLLDTYEAQEERAATNTATTNAALDAANLELTTLREQVAKVAPLETELAVLIAGNAEWRAAQHKLLVSENQQYAWDVERSKNAARETLESAQAQFGARGQQILLDFVQKLVEQFHIPEPNPSALPNGISPLVLTLWRHHHVKAQIMLAYAKSYPEPNEAFKNTLFRILLEGLPQVEGAKSDPILDIAVKREVLIAMARSWNVLDEVTRRVDAEQIQRQAAILRTHYADMHAQELESIRRGEGRTPIAVAEPQTTDSRFWDGFIPANPPAKLPAGLREDVGINERQEADLSALEYGTRLIERESLAKKGKIVTVPPPESLGIEHSLDDEEAAL